MWPLFLLIGAPCIALDPGHGGPRDDGTTYLEVKEKNLTLSITKRTKEALQALGYDVVTTREDDRDIGLLERARIVNKSGCKLLVSIHVNGSVVPSMYGLESYSLDTGKQRLARRLKDLLGPSASESAVIVRDMKARHYAELGADLTRLVHERVLENARILSPETRSNGVRRDLLLLLLAAEMPATLVETGYLSNGRERGLLTDGRYQAAIATGISAGVKRYMETHP